MFSDPIKKIRDSIDRLVNDCSIFTQIIVVGIVAVVVVGFIIAFGKLTP